MKRVPLRVLLRSGAHVGAVMILIAAIAWLRRAEPANAPLRLHAVIDVTGHLLTAGVAVVGVRALRLPIPAWAILLGGIVLDLGHVLGKLGYVNALEGSTRNGSHSLFVVAVLACLGFADARRANIWLGIAIGATSHLWRDMGTGTVALMWPITETVYGTLFRRYLAVLAGMAIAMIGTSALLAAHAASHAPRGNGSDGVGAPAGHIWTPAAPAARERKENAGGH